MIFNMTAALGLVLALTGFEAGDPALPGDDWVLSGPMGPQLTPKAIEPITSMLA